eukprot:TRINITY_DN81280_c0_g1_i1.p1 TRINITY_DN81280_c0_g1~~TRINITY_DN81280_c0_g1_i1.p1  ORF type:complete len:1486 (+),score=495.64 TRINITY_DN81280_c0_g1_i1:141-4598(+)
MARKIRHPPTIANVVSLQAAPWKRTTVSAIFVLLYAMSAQMWWTTAGEPYQWALDEQKRIIKEKASALKDENSTVAATFANLKDKTSKQKELEIDYEQLPSQILPSAWACAFIFFNVTTHLLFHLCCIWMVGFKAASLYSSTHKIQQGCYLRVTPHANKGKADIVPLGESEVSMKLTFTFQYQAYEVIEAGEEDADLLGDLEAAGVRLIPSPINLPWKEYQKSRGLKKEGEIEKATDMFGTNIFELPKPTFWQLYKAQLLSPLAIFQFFCTALWMLDTYWKYTCFTLLSVLGFEASTAFQRLKSMATLRGMSTKSYNVYLYRQQKWEEHPIEDILPGDILSLTDTKHTEEAQPADSSSLTNGEKKAADANKHVTVPCDCLLLRGSAIVNEATLTGESVPQMKDALVAAADANEKVDAFGKHRIHALFSGTSLIQATGDSSSSSSTAAPVKDEEKPISAPPDNGIVCYVLRTGFNSSQGELMRMIEFSTQDVSADKIETACQLLFLLMFALVAAGYVLKKGLEDPTKPTYKTLLRCILIVTSVVPPSLPMQMAFAVHTALMSLLKSGIFCTEPFRVPYAGKVDYCFFDKTGTLTSDQMVAVGIVNAESKPSKAVDGAIPMDNVKEASTMAAMVVAGCHSLIEVDGRALGDPIEVAAMRAVGWSYEPDKQLATPTAWRIKEQYVTKQKELLKTFQDDVEADKQQKADTLKRIDEKEKEIKKDKEEAKKLHVNIEQRYHFSSELQRMSVICKVTSSGSQVPAGTYCLTKGSPEVIGRLCKTKPEWFDTTYTAMAEKGARVLALAYRHVSSDRDMAKQFAQKPREEGEVDLTFAGFIAFKCETRKDSKLVIQALQDSKQECIMLTGDAPLTALSVGFEVGIARKPAEKALILAQKEGSADALEWRPATTAALKSGKPQSFVPSEISKLAADYDLVITGKTLELALNAESAKQLEEHLHSVCIYARLSPWQKEQVIQAVKRNQKAATLMCGDGGNDVGALKEADVGLALLSGFGNANVNPDEAEALAKITDKGKDAEDALAEQRKENAEKAKELSKKAGEDMARKRKDLMSKQQQWVEEEMQARRERGEDTGFMGQMAAMKTVMGRLQGELKKEQEQIQKKHGNAFAAGAAKWAGDMEGMEDTPMVQLGDASTAAPFTSRTPSIGACIDIIRQGRCTLLSAVQQMEIMMLESMISAYTLSTMSVDGTQKSEAQMMASGTLISVASLAFSFARPLEKMHPTRPLGSVFHPAIFFSMLGQLVIHLFCMVYIANLAKEIMGESALKEIIEFEKQRNAHIDSLDEEAFNDSFWWMSVPFKSNLLNTCCWLVETSQQISVIFVNYKGRPWMKGLLENQPLFLSLVGCVIMVAVCAWGAIPYLNDLLNLVVVPEELRPKVMATLLVSLIGTFLWDRLMIFLFAPQIFKTMVEEIKATEVADFMPLAKTLGMGVGGLLLLGAGNPIMWGLAYMAYRNYKSSQAPAEGNGGAAAAPRA